MKGSAAGAGDIGKSYYNSKDNHEKLDDFKGRHGPLRVKILDNNTPVMCNPDPIAMTPHARNVFKITRTGANAFRSWLKEGSTSLVACPEARSEMKRSDRTTSRSIMEVGLMGTGNTLIFRLMRYAFLFS